MRWLDEVTELGHQYVSEAVDMWTKKQKVCPSLVLVPPGEQVQVVFLKVLFYISKVTRLQKVWKTEQGGIQLYNPIVLTLPTVTILW